MFKELLVVILGDGLDDKLEEEKKGIKLLHHQHKFYEQHFIFPLTDIKSDETTTIIAQVGDGVVATYFGIVTKIVEVSSSMEMFFFHVVVVVVEVGNNFGNDFVTQASY
jgi:hypothetical protein